MYSHSWWNDSSDSAKKLSAVRVASSDADGKGTANLNQEDSRDNATTGIDRTKLGNLHKKNSDRKIIGHANSKRDDSKITAKGPQNVTRDKSTTASAVAGSGGSATSRGSTANTNAFPATTGTKIWRESPSNAQITEPVRDEFGVSNPEGGDGAEIPPNSVENAALGVDGGKRDQDGGTNGGGGGRDQGGTQLDTVWNAYSHGSWVDGQWVPKVRPPSDLGERSLIVQNIRAQFIFFNMRYVIKRCCHTLNEGERF